MKTNNNFNLLLIIVLSASCAPTQALQKGAIAAITLGVSAAGLYSFYRWLKSEEHFQPTIDNLNTYTFKQSSKTYTEPRQVPPHHNQLNTNQQDIFSGDTIPHISIGQLVTHINKNKPPKKAHVSLPTQKNINDNTMPIKTVLAEKGITTTYDDPTIFIFSRGYARTNTPGTNDNMLQKGGCAMAAFMPIQDNIINHAPCITFDYPDRRRCFNFGQAKDTECLKLVYDQTIEQNPHAQIILVGDCRGAKTILNFASQQPKNLSTLVLLSPFFSAKELTEQVAHNYLSWLPYSSELLHNFFKLWFPSYDTHADETFAQHCARIAHNIPIFIAHRNKDTLVSTEQVTGFIDTLQKGGHRKIHFIATDDATARHSRLTPVKTIQYEVNKFFHAYNLPHNPALLVS